MQILDEDPEMKKKLLEALLAERAQKAIAILLAVRSQARRNERKEVSIKG